MVRKSTYYQYRFLGIFIFSFILISCQIQQDQEGNIIPSEKAIRNPFNLNKNLEYINELIQNNDDPVLRLYRAKILIKNHLYDKALVDLNEIRNVYEGDADYLFLRAKALMSLNKISEFREVFRELNSLEVPTMDHLSLNLEWYYQNNHKDSVKINLDKISSLGYEAGNFPFMTHLNFWINGDTLGLINDLKQVVWQEIPSDLDLKIYFDQINFLENSKNFSRNLNIVLKTYPQDYHYFPMMVNELFLKNNFEKVVFYLEKYDQQAELSSRYRFQLGISYFKLKNYSKSIENFNLIKRSDKEFAESEFYRGLSLLYSHRAAEAYELLDTLTKRYSYRTELMTMYHAINSKRFAVAVDSLETNSLNP